MAKILVAFGDSWPWGSELDSLSSPDRFSKLDVESQEKLLKVLGTMSEPRSKQNHVDRAALIQNTFRYPTLVGQALKVDQVLNLTGYGTSLNHLFLYLTEFIDYYRQHPDNQYIFLVSLTASDRDLYFDPQTGEPKEIMPWDGGLGAYYKYFHHQNTGETNWAKNVMMMQMFCKLHNIPDFYFQAFRPHFAGPQYVNNIDYSRIYCKSERSFIDMFAARESVVLDCPTDSAFYQPEIKKYFYPCQHHPNILGHETIADEIVSFIKSLNPELVPV